MKTGLAAIIIGAVALAILGLVVVLLPGPTASFGWFAFQSAGDFGFVGGALFVPASRLWGLGILAIAAVIGAFVTGWVLGKRRGGRESEMKEPTRTSARVVLRAAEERDQAARQALGWHASIERNYGHEAPDGLMTDDDARDWFAEQVALAEDGARRGLREALAARRNGDTARGGEARPAGALTPRREGHRRAEADPSSTSDPSARVVMRYLGLVSVMDPFT